VQVIYDLHPERLDELSLSHFNFNFDLHSHKFVSEAIPKYHRSANISKAKCPQHFSPTASTIQGESYSHFADGTSAKVK
jgi:hypothetical protein